MPILTAFPAPTASALSPSESHEEARSPALSVRRGGANAHQAEFADLLLAQPIANSPMPAASPESALVVPPAPTNPREPAFLFGDDVDPEAVNEGDAAFADDRQELPPAELVSSFFPPLPPPPPAAPPPPKDPSSTDLPAAWEDSELAGFANMPPPIPSARSATDATSSSSPLNAPQPAGEGEGETAEATLPFDSIARPAVFSHPRSRSSTEDGVNAVPCDKNTKESAMGQIVMGADKARGMEKAEAPLIMNRAFAAEPSAAASSGAVSTADASAASQPTSALDPMTNIPARSSGHEPPAPSIAASALRLIERVELAADQLSALRSREEFRFNVDVAGRHRVEVKVAVRDGRVFAAFRADSSELRDALARGWETFVRSREGGAQRWAEPVFSAHAPSASAASPAERAHGASVGEFASGRDSSADDRPSSRREYPAAAEDRVLSDGRAVVSRSAVPPVGEAPMAASRPDGSRLLSVLA